MNADNVDHKRRRLLTTAATVVGGVGAVFVAVPFVSSMQPSARAQAAGAPVEIDIGALKAGEVLTVEWRGKPVWVLRRTPEMLQGLEKVADKLADPKSEELSQQPPYANNPYRSIKPELLVLVGICTHLGCSPLMNFQTGSQSGLDADWPGGFFCPCHGSKFDLAGRVYKGVPAPTKLVVPPYSYLSETRILVGVDPKAA